MNTSQNNDIVVKIYSNIGTRRVAVPSGTLQDQSIVVTPGISLSNLKRHVSNLYCVNNETSALWLANDGDKLPLCTDIDLRSAMSNTRHILRLFMTVDKQDLHQDALNELSKRTNILLSSFKEFSKAANAVLPSVKAIKHDEDDDINQQQQVRPARQVQTHKPKVQQQDDMPRGRDCKLMARFVKDATLPDGMEVRPNQKLLKSWVVRNESGMPWPVECRLDHVGGDDLRPGDIIKTCGTLKPGKGEEIDVSLSVLAPPKCGRYVAYYRLSDADGQRFGQRLRLDLQVVDGTGPSMPMIRNNSVHTDMTGGSTDNDMDNDGDDLSAELRNAEFAVGMGSPLRKSSSSTQGIVITDSQRQYFISNPNTSTRRNDFKDDDGCDGVLNMISFNGQI